MYMCLLLYQEVVVRRRRRGNPFSFHFDWLNTFLTSSFSCMRTRTLYSKSRVLLIFHHIPILPPSALVKYIWKLLFTRYSRRASSSFAQVAFSNVSIDIKTYAFVYNAIFFKYIRCVHKEVMYLMYAN